MKSRGPMTSSFKIQAEQTYTVRVEFSPRGRDVVCYVDGQEVARKKHVYLLRNKPIAFSVGEGEGHEVQIRIKSTGFYWSAQAYVKNTLIVKELFPKMRVYMLLGAFFIISIFYLIFTLTTSFGPNM